MTVGIHAGLPLLKSAVRLTVYRSADIPAHLSDLQCVCVRQHLHVCTNTLPFRVIYSCSELNTLYVCIYVRLRDRFCEAAWSRGCAAACPTVPGFYDFWGLAHRGEEFLHIWSETEECLTGVWQSKWAATEGDSVSGGNRLGHISAINWWCWRGFRARRDGVIPGSLHALPPVLYNCLGLLGQKTVISLEIVPSVAPWCRQHH